MVLMRRKDKRKGNDDVAICDSITDSVRNSKNKGMRSLGGPISAGKFAADRRSTKGGYGRKDKTWGIDHPWHETSKGDLFEQICSKDRLEEGSEVSAAAMAKGLSRASKRRKKKANKPLVAKPIVPEQPKISVKKTSAPPVKKKKKVAAAPPVPVEFEDLNAAEHSAALTAAAAKTEEEYEKQAKEFASMPLGTEMQAPSGLVVIENRLGNGSLPSQGQMITCRYRGYLNQECSGYGFAKGMMTLTLGQDSMIAGFDEGIRTMRPGGKRRLVIPSVLGYGAEGKGDKIPPNSTLYFDLELIRIGKRKRDTGTAVKNAGGKSDGGVINIPLPKAFSRKQTDPEQVKSKTGEKKRKGSTQPLKRKKSLKKMPPKNTVSF